MMEGGVLRTGRKEALSSSPFSSYSLDSNPRLIKILCFQVGEFWMPSPPLAAPDRCQKIRRLQGGRASIPMPGISILKKLPATQKRNNPSTAQYGLRSLWDVLYWPMA
jgi:hypothetical protein